MLCEKSVGGVYEYPDAYLLRALRQPVYRRAARRRRSGHRLLVQPQYPPLYGIPRPAQLRQYAQDIALPLLEKNDYGLRPFIREVCPDFAGRCVKCYEMRLYEAARQARDGGFDSFTSSLFISPYQKHDLMREVAEQAAAAYGVAFLYRDFRPYFRAGQERARELGFYMQKYCGCIFSEEERYLKPGKILP